MIPALTHVLEPAYLAGLSNAPVERVRAMRAECTDLENGLSYVRRIVQGRLDLLAAETRRRGAGTGGDLHTIVEELAETLSDGVRGPASGRVDQHLEPPEHILDQLTDALDRAVGSGAIDVIELDDTELADMVGGLRTFEERVSAARRSLHDAIDGLNNELARRIASGEASAGPY